MSNKPSLGTRFLTVFGLPFLAVGCVMGYFSGRMISEHMAARQWVERPATIHDVSLRVSSDGDGTTYRVRCTYSYEFNGRRYKCDRVGLTGGSDNIGSWHQRTHARLKAAQSRKSTVPCYVNPAQPGEALLDREIRLWMLFFYLVFVTVFGGVGAAFVGGGALSLLHARRIGRERPHVEAPADQPWLSDPRWASGIIRSSAKRTAVLAVVTACFWNALWLPFAAFVPREVSRGDYLALLALIPPLIGILIAVGAVRCVSRYRRFGRSYFECNPVPGVIGGRLRGDLVLAGDIHSLDKIEITLQCRHTQTVRNGGESSTRTENLWECSQTLDSLPGRFGEEEMRLPVNIQIPGTCRPTDESDTNDKVEWKLLARAPVIGVDLAMEFDVPVFRTKESEAVLEAESPEAAEDPVVHGAVPPPLARIRRERDTNANPVLIASAWPGMGMAGVLLAFGSLFTGVAVFMTLGVLKGNWFMLLFALVFGALGLLIWMIFLSFFGTCRVTVMPGEIRVRRTYGPFSIHRTIEASGLRLSVKESASSGSRKWYAVHAAVPGGKKVCLAGMIEGLSAARWFKRQIEQLTAQAAAGPR